MSCVCDQRPDHGSIRVFFGRLVRLADRSAHEEVGGRCEWAPSTRAVSVRG